jgi:ferric-dicitrate binding protein FerR (iron transport regulator)
MFLRHRYTSKRLAAYCHGELTERETRHVTAHLQQCARCRQAYAEIQWGHRLASRLVLHPAPESLWDKIEARLAAPASAEAGASLPIRKTGLPAGRRPALALGVALLFLLGGALVWRHRRPVPTPPSSASWEVARISGAPRIGTDRLTGTGRLAVGQWLETDAVSRAKITVANIGHVEVEPQTRIGLEVTRANEHRLNLKQGTMHAKINAPPRLFLVDTPSARAVDLGCAYTLTVDAAGNSLLTVRSGRVELVYPQGRQATVPAGGICATRKGRGPGTPYFGDAPQALRAALTQYDFDNGDVKALRAVVSRARPRDTLTLWYLLIHVPPKDRCLVYDRLTTIVSPPPGLTRRQVQQMDAKTIETELERWREEIEQDWYN